MIIINPRKIDAEMDEAEIIYNGIRVAEVNIITTDNRNIYIHTRGTQYRNISSFSDLYDKKMTYSRIVNAWDAGKNDLIKVDYNRLGIDILFSSKESEIISSLFIPIHRILLVISEDISGEWPILGCSGKEIEDDL